VRKGNKTREERQLTEACSRGRWRSRITVRRSFFTAPLPVSLYRSFLLHKEWEGGGKRMKRQEKGGRRAEEARIWMTSGPGNHLHQF